MNDKISVKEVLNRLREISKKQQKSIKQKLQQEELAKKKSIAKPCKVCGEAVAGIMEHSQKMISDIATLKEMYRNKLYTIKEKGLTLTIDDIEARIEREKCNAQKSWERYLSCCKEGNLLSKEQFKC